MNKNKKAMGTVSAVMVVLVTLIVVVGVVLPILYSMNTTGMSTIDALIYSYIPTFLLLGAGLLLVVKYFFN